jgi:hypothetical protein
MARLPVRATESLPLYIQPHLIPAHNHAKKIIIVEARFEAPREARFQKSCEAPSEKR